MTEALITAAAAIIVAVIECAAAIERRQVRQDRQRMERRATRRAEESRLSMDLMYATCALSLTTAKKLAGHHTNGDVEEAMAKAVEAQEKYWEFTRQQTAENVAKV